MASFSVTAAATAGFGVIARKPLAVIGWGLALVVALALPALLCVAAMGPDFMLMFQAAAQTGDDAEYLNRLMRMQSGMMALNMLYWLWSSFVSAVLCAAVFRAVLSPEQSAWAYLRVGSREMWLTLLMLVEQVLAMIVVFVVVLLVAVLTAIAGFGGGENGVMAAIVTGTGGAIVAGAVLLWLALRLSLALPMTFVDNQFRLFESWSLTKGHALKLLGVALLIVLLVLLLEVVAGGIVVGLIVAFAGSLSGLQSAGGVDVLLSQAPMTLLRAIWPFLAALAVVMSVLGAVLQLLFYAPWAAAHRALTQQP
ncbi:hypothetical protein [Caulobacter sp. RHG1]|uniref:hypothetical protein n=1 Tax=Caulobacter sp. (strain RHG1) TaxID=2545762 RepID=UPI0015560218|nr:hypothetical protein [Caulobacter sp. RHG1]NQE62548.1 hypothetical protein [Caulobacter sp. RHG1]